MDTNTTFRFISRIPTSTQLYAQASAAPQANQESKPEDFETLFKELNDANGTNQWTAMIKLSQIAPSHKDALLNLLGNVDEKTRKNAQLILGFLEGKDWHSMIDTLVTETNPVVQLSKVELARIYFIALGNRRGTPEPLPFLESEVPKIITLLKSPRPEIAQAAAEAIFTDLWQTYIFDPESKVVAQLSFFPAIIDTSFAHSDPKVREWCTAALQKMPPKIARIVIERLKNGDATVKASAAEALENYARRSGVSDIPALNEIVPLLLTQKKYADEEVAKHAHAALEQFADQMYPLPTMLNLAKSPDANMRAFVSRSFGYNIAKLVADGFFFELDNQYFKHEYGKPFQDAIAVRLNPLLVLGNDTDPQVRAAVSQSRTDIQNAIQKYRDWAVRDKKSASTEITNAYLRVSQRL